MNLGWSVIIYHHLNIHTGKRLLYYAIYYSYMYMVQWNCNDMLAAVEHLMKRTALALYI